MGTSAAGSDDESLQGTSQNGPSTDSTSKLPASPAKNARGESNTLLSSPQSSRPQSASPVLVDSQSELLHQSVVTRRRGTVPNSGSIRKGDSKDDLHPSTKAFTNSRGSSRNVPPPQPFLSINNNNFNEANEDDVTTDSDPAKETDDNEEPPQILFRTNNSANNSVSSNGRRPFLSNPSSPRASQATSKVELNNSTASSVTGSSNQGSSTNENVTEPQQSTSSSAFSETPPTQFNFNQNVHVTSPSGIASRLSRTSQSLGDGGTTNMAMRQSGNSGSQIRKPYRPVYDANGVLFERRIVPVVKEDLDQQMYKTTHIDDNDEDVVLLQVISFILFIGVTTTAVAFVSGSPISIAACCVGAIISIIGWFGASRRNIPLLKVFWMALGVWVLLLIAFMAWMIYGSSMIDDAVVKRCEDDLFRMGVIVECDIMTLDECVAECRDVLKSDLLLSYSISGGLLSLLLIFFVWKTARLQIAFAKAEHVRRLAYLKMNPEQTDLYNQTGDMNDLYMDSERETFTADDAYRHSASMTGEYSVSRSRLYE